MVDDPWKAVKDTYTIGQAVEGEVHKIEAFGLMIKLDDAIHGLAHISEVSDKQISDEELRAKFPIGSTHKFEIINIEPSEHRLGLKVFGVKGKTEKKDAPAAEKTEETAPETTESEA